jgi:ATP-dependent helicase HrpA
VLATNVAETSLTVPGIKYVIDPGTARISRYSYRTKVQRLPIEPVSQASANQRKGRCGRVSEGICIRLYSEDDFLSRPEFTDPEILRTNLASVILQMTALGSAILPRSRSLKRRISAIFRTACACWKSWGRLPPTSSRPPIS